ncbi:nucleosome assembly protein 1-like 1-B [Microplitis mediator]|uniref:nucleosome assembly protein 1-like 1-B n=1 Tax=Microplitis mediator TaxID=375433 RepID=UPI0025573698|nr:nucleosome assembly protein 1-like 1-B [Microplitis mediator]
MASHKLQRRIQALKNIQYEYFEIQRQIDDKLDEIKIQFEPAIGNLNKRRHSIIGSSHEPDDEEYIAIDGGEETTKTIMRNLECDVEGELEGVPNFWLTVLQNNNTTKRMIRKRDVPILKFPVEKVL